MLDIIKKSYADKRILSIFLNGIASGFPWVIIGSGMTLWLNDAGLTRTAIGFFGSIFFVYSINFLWAPLLDKIKLPFLQKFGKRKSWLIVLQGLLFIFTLALYFADPSINTVSYDNSTEELTGSSVNFSIIWLSLIAFSIALLSATQDIAIDAYRIDIINKDEAEKIASGSAAATAGWWVGFGFLGAIALYIADTTSWNNTFLIMSVFFLLFLLHSWFMPPEDELQTKEELITPIVDMFVLPLKDFFSRFGWLAISLLLFIMFFKIGEAFLGKMSLIFYTEIGFSKSEIASYQKLFGTVVIIIFSVIASFVSIKYGLIRGLIIGGIAMASTNLLYSYLATIGANANVLLITLTLDNFTTAFSTVAFVAFISSLINKAYSATQYAALASLGNLGKILLASSSGLLVDGLDGNWTIFFIITSIMVIPSLLILIIISRKLKPLIKY